MKKSTVCALVCLLLTLTCPTQAWARELSLGGQAVGIRIRTEGVLVAGLSQVEGGTESRCPAEEAGLAVGDRIIAVDGRSIESVGELVAAVEESAGAPVRLTLQRQEERLEKELCPVRSGEGQWMLGLWLQDGISGIGTLTFCDPATGIYGALGHGVSGEESREPLPLRSGEITDAEILGVNKGAAGAPGELNGCVDEGQVLGSVELNGSGGIYGHAFSALGGRTVETGQPCPGPATVLSTVSGREAREYHVEITRVFRDSNGCHVMLTVTDPALRELTGGIVQGMSGSPILQEGKLVAAVTHVSVST